MREYKLKSKNSYELYYSRKIGKSSYMDMEQVCGNHSIFRLDTHVP